MRRNSKLLANAIFSAIALLATTTASLADSAPSQDPFVNLYHDFTGIHDGMASSIANKLAIALEKKEHMSADGPLILIVESGIYAYEPSTRKLTAYAFLRSAAENNGFIPLTSVSHIGPAISYLANLKELGDPEWKTSAEKLLQDIVAVKKANALSKQNWLDSCQDQAMAVHKTEVQSLIDYACYMSGSYMKSVLTANGANFSTTSVSNDLFNARSQKYPIPFKNIMVGTFALVALNDYYSAYRAFAGRKINWKKAKVLIQFHAGSNFSGGLSKDTNHLYKFLRLLSNEQIPENRIFFTPYAETRSMVGQDILPVEDFNYYAQEVWYHHYARPKVALSGAFQNVDTIFVPDRPVLPGDREYSSADKIDDFMMRLKYSLGNNTELLSNTIGFWMSGELQRAGWKPENVQIPGLTHGFPDGVKAYPNHNPEIE